MIDDPLTPEEQQATQQLRAAGIPKLDTAAREAIRQQMLNELRISSPNRATRPIWKIAAVAAVVVLALVVGQHLSLPSAAQQIVIAPTRTLTVTKAAVMNATVQPASPTATPGATFSPTPSDVIVVLEGTVTNIGDSSLTINGFTVQVDPQNPILPLLDLGDTVHIEGTLDANGMIAAVVVSNTTDTTVVGGSPATVSLDGPVESIDGNHLVVNNVPVQLAPNDPLAGKLKIGDFVHVQGNFQGTGAATVLVIVNITIINNVIVNGTPTCRYDVDGMGMGHWHCDNGMGMGSGNSPPAGMGNPNPGMGMGN